jgi:hypothetical protein
MESRAIVATGVSTQVGSVSAAVPEELDNVGRTSTEELDSMTGAVAELEFTSAELAGSCSVEELEIVDG